MPQSVTRVINERCTTEIHPSIFSAPSTSTVSPPLLQIVFHQIFNKAAKLSSILLPRTLSFASGTHPPPSRDSVNSMNSDKKAGRRRRSSSVIIYQEPLESPEQLSDQSALPNLNASWVNSKGKGNLYFPFPHCTRQLRKQELERQFANTIPFY